jgi:hypothetical protein
MSEATCIFCKRNSNQIPLVAMQYQQQTYHICPEHLPLLIHEPEKLAGLLPGAESMNAAPTGD